ncbi:hypothetical protein EVAR_37948_1 [Eumeta japonica]|uniref:Uncharacterized protein n=1 Tax=Eumeta variegata TaxID=151549 RepID=A0A4C1XC38_EUMVA|nr:hypothetical protein EVAR_37948_1 [Eumeta japonica]
MCLPEQIRPLDACDPIIRRPLKESRSVDARRMRTQRAGPPRALSAAARALSRRDKADQNFVSELGVESVSSSAVEGGLTVAGRAHNSAVRRARPPCARVSYRAANERSDPAHPRL